MSIQLLTDSIGVIPDYPVDGVYFRDISPILKNPELRTLTFNLLEQLINNIKIDYIAGIESQGYVFAMGLAQKLDIGFVMLKKTIIMPDTHQVYFDKDHGEENILCVQKGLIEEGKNVLVVDDLLASGGTIVKACELITLSGAPTFL
jgi:adenine phosphoribosyltransferase